MQPERPLEKLLRAFAKKRRDQAGDPLELRPAARERLQQEISRRATAKSGGGFLSNLSLLFRPRFAFALCSIAILLVGGWFLLATLGEKSKQPELAYAGSSSAETSRKEMPEPLPALSPRPAAAPVVAGEEDKRRLDSDGAAVKPAHPNEVLADAPTIASRAETTKQINGGEYEILQTNTTAGMTVASAPAPASTFSKTESVASDSFGGADTLKKDNADRVLQPVAPPVTMPAPAVVPMLAQRDQEKKLETQKQPVYASAASGSAYESAEFKAAAEPPVATQAFNRLDMAADGKHALGLVKVPAPVLNSFRLEQNGNDLRVVDADGSVYTGAVQVVKLDRVAPAAGFGGGAKTKSTTAPPMRTSPQSTALNYFFTVAGTNRNLNQNVVFSGNLIPLTNFLALHSNTSAIGGTLRTGRTVSKPEPSLLSNSRISGKAVIGNDKEIEVNATPAP